MASAVTSSCPLTLKIRLIARYNVRQDISNSVWLNSSESSKSKRANTKRSFPSVVVFGLSNTPPMRAKRKETVVSFNHLSVIENGFCNSGRRRQPILHASFELIPRSPFKDSRETSYDFAICCEAFRSVAHLLNAETQNWRSRAGK